MEEEHVPSLLTLAGIEIELSELIGRKVDLRTPDELRQNILNRKIDLVDLEEKNPFVDFLKKHGEIGYVVYLSQYIENEFLLLYWLIEMPSNSFKFVRIW